MHSLFTGALIACSAYLDNIITYVNSYTDLLVLQALDPIYAQSGPID